MWSEWLERTLGARELEEYEARRAVRAAAVEEDESSPPDDEGPGDAASLPFESGEEALLDVPCA